MVLVATKLGDMQWMNVVLNETCNQFFVHSMICFAASKSYIFTVLTSIVNGHQVVGSCTSLCWSICNCQVKRWFTCACTLV